MAVLFKFIKSYFAETDFLIVKYFFSTLLISTSQIAFALSEADKLDAVEIAVENGVTLKEISVRLTLNKADDFMPRLLESFEYHKRTNTPPRDPILVPDKPPINSFNEVLVYRYFTKYDFSKVEEIKAEVELLRAPISRIAEQNAVQLITIKPVIISTSKTKEGYEQNYKFESHYYFYKHSDGHWELFKE